MVEHQQHDVEGLSPGRPRQHAMQAPSCLHRWHVNNG